MAFKELREQSGMNKTQFAEYFGIPYRTIQNWEYGERECPEYLLDLMAYKLRIEKHKADFIKLAEYLADNEDTDIKLYCNAGLSEYPGAMLEDIT
jgi:transcriptional regulator with XRE-family HTH domain